MTNGMTQSDGIFVETLNNMGVMLNTLDEFTWAYVEFAPKAPGPVLEVGSAFGSVTIEALKRGATRVFANDMEPRHLEILEDRTPLELKPHLTCLPGRFPEDLFFDDNSLGAIVIARVLHFFEGPKIEHAARTLFNWLMPGGKVFVTCETPYLKNLQGFQDEYQRRVQAGEPWPGWIENFSKYDTHRAKILPRQMHMMDETVLCRIFTDAGFCVERVHTFGRPDFPDDIRLDGRESVGLLATKL